MIARGGARAIATSSAAAANALGYADGQHLTREQMLGAVAAIAGAVDLPVTADMEAGYGDEPEAAAATARGVVEAGAVGLNMEDLSDGGDDLLPIDRFAAKIAAVRAVGDEDRHSARAQRPHGRLPRPDRRSGHARSSTPSSADGRISMPERTASSCPASSIRPSITALVQGIDGPVSLLAVPGSPPLSDLKALGVARISTGSGPYRAALALARRMADEAYGQGSLEEMIAAQVAFADAQALFPS